MHRIFTVYYAATVLFLLLDYWAGFNIRTSFLGSYPLWRAAYYGVCFLCLGIMLWQPALTVIVTAFESLVTMCALIISFGMRVILATDLAADDAGFAITVPQLLNFLLSGGIAYLAWLRGVRELSRATRAR